MSSAVHLTLNYWRSPFAFLQLGEYQEQAYLLDPYLDSLVTPVVEKLKAHARSFVVHRGYSWSLPRIGRLALLLYNYIRCRGYKTISQ
jgi:tubulin-specific chaperone D